MTSDPHHAVRPRHAGSPLRMTTVMFLLGALFVAFMVVLMWSRSRPASAGWSRSIALIGLGMAWWTSGTTPTRSRSGRCGPAWSHPSRRPSCTA